MTTSLYRIYCNTENAFVNGQSTGLLTSCPNNAGHNVNPNSSDIVSGIGSVSSVELTQFGGNLSTNTGLVSSGNDIFWRTINLTGSTILTFAGPFSTNSGPYLNYVTSSFNAPVAGNYMALFALTYYTSGSQGNMRHLLTVGGATIHESILPLSQSSITQRIPLTTYNIAPLQAGSNPILFSFSTTSSSNTLYIQDVKLYIKQV